MSNFHIQIKIYKSSEFGTTIKYFNEIRIIQKPIFEGVKLLLTIILSTTSENIE